VAPHSRPGRAGASQCQPPHYFKRLGLESGVYVRVGSTNRRADRDLVDELRRFARGEAYDEQPMPGLDSEALDFRAASEFDDRLEVENQGFCSSASRWKIFAVASRSCAIVWLVASSTGSA